MKSEKFQSEIIAFSLLARIKVEKVLQYADENNIDSISELFVKCKICGRIVFINAPFCPHCKSIGRLKNPNKQPFKDHKKPGRNTPCPCGSGKKFKKCHGR